MTLRRAPRARATSGSTSRILRSRATALRTMVAISDRGVIYAPYEVATVGDRWIRNTASRYGLSVTVLAGGGLSVTDQHESLLSVNVTPKEDHQ